MGKYLFRNKSGQGRRYCRFVSFYENGNGQVMRAVRSSEGLAMSRNYGERCLKQLPIQASA